jgi:hypothetical protein
VAINDEAPRSQALDAWDYQAPFSQFHIRWDEGDITPAFEQAQAYAIAHQDLHLGDALEIWAHREVLATFTSDHIQVGHGPADREPAWVIMVAGQKRPPAPGARDPFPHIPASGGAVVQLLIHARTGELLLGTAVPVALQRRD